MSETDKTLIASSLTFRKYALRVWRQFKEDSKREVLTNVIAILAIIVVLVCQWQFGWVKAGEGWTTTFTNVAPALTVLAIYLVYHFIRAPYLLDRGMTIDLTLTRQEKIVFEDFVNNPRLELIFQNEKPYFNTVPALTNKDGKIELWRSYLRVRVENKSGKVIDNVKVQIEELFGYYNIPLRILNDRTGRTDFRLTPGQWEMIEIATKHSNQGGITIESISQGLIGESWLTSGQHRVNIVATGSDTVPYSREFLLSSTPQGYLAVEALPAPTALSLASHTQGLLPSQTATH